MSSGIKRVLIVCSINHGKLSPFVKEQTDSLANCGIETDYYFINGKGIKGYLKNLKSLRLKIKEYAPDLIHAHYGFSGLLCSLQRIAPVIVTFHGSDVQLGFRNFILSKITMILCRNYIFVSDNLKKIAKSKKGMVIPCGIDTELFKPMDKMVCREKLNLDTQMKYVLFSSHFENEVKNYPLAKEALIQLNDPSVELLALKNYSRQEVALLMNAVDVCLLTSFSEGSPQFIKEALACNRPIVSTKVGDVENLFQGIENVYITGHSPNLVASKIELALKSECSSGRKKIELLRLDLKSVGEKLIDFYSQNLNFN
jgi:teichuronic acid biosynthesis glycosyltransferase TuaC